ncbi:MAG: YheT family hydrolase [Desulfovibrionales bacterium]
MKPSKEKTPADGSFRPTNGRAKTERLSKIPSNRNTLRRELNFFSFVKPARSPVFTQQENGYVPRMPVIEKSTYKPPSLLPGGHLQTVYPVLFRKTPAVPYARERIETPDGDFLDIDWSRTGSSRVAFLSHGLEGCSDKKYIRSMVRVLNKAGWDCAALNFRGCSGEINRTPRLYHSGTTDDLHTALTHVLLTGRYMEATLVGFSMGGNQTLKYLGEDDAKIPSQVSSAVVFSVPCDLEGAAVVMAAPSNRIYMHYFLMSLRQKILLKKKKFPDKFDVRGLQAIRTFKEFDDRFTAPLHGFKDAHDYWHTCSSLRFLSDVSRPTLVVNAGNDPFLSPSCYPIRHAENNPFLFAENPAAGGHVGFPLVGADTVYWSEKRALQFLQQVTTGF